MATVGTMAVKVDLDTSKLDDAITRLEATLARIESLERGNTPAHSGEDLTRAYERLIAVINSRASNWGL